MDEEPTTNPKTTVVDSSSSNNNTNNDEEKGPPPSLSPAPTTNNGNDGDDDEEEEDDKSNKDVEVMPSDEDLAVQDPPEPQQQQQGKSDGDEEVPSTPNKDGKADNNHGNKDGFVKEGTKISKTKKKKKKVPEMNPKFKDVQETGKWGEMSKKELYIAVGVFLVIAVVVIAVVVTVVVPSGDGGGGTVVTVQERTVRTLDYVRAGINASDVTSPLLEGLPDDPAFYEPLLDDGTPQQQAMAWLLYEDEEYRNLGESTLRWALASIYFQMGGPQWTSSEGWLEPISVCDWEHLDCDTRGILQQVDFDEQNLVGTIPVEIALLGNNIQSISMKRNGLTGRIPADVFASLPRLGMLYLDHNGLTGTVPANLDTLCKWTRATLVCVALCCPWLRYRRRTAKH
jgi:hypothetical protein